MADLVTGHAQPDRLLRLNGGNNVPGDDLLSESLAKWPQQSLHDPLQAKAP